MHCKIPRLFRIVYFILLCARALCYASAPTQIYLNPINPIHSPSKLFAGGYLSKWLTEEIDTQIFTLGGLGAELLLTAQSRVSNKKMSNRHPKNFLLWRAAGLKYTAALHTS